MDAGACLRLQASPSRPSAEDLSAGVPYRRVVGGYRTAGGIGTSETTVESNRTACIPYCVAHNSPSRSSVFVMPGNHALPSSTACLTLAGESVQS